MDPISSVSNQEGFVESTMRDQMEEKLKAVLHLESRIKGGSRWFFWIAGLSIINSVLFYTGSELVFVVGLGTTQLIDGFSKALLNSSSNVGASLLLFLVDVLIALVIILFGYYAGQKNRWAFIVGIIVYVCDTILMLIFQQMLGLAFHIIGLLGIYNGFSALNTLRKKEAKANSISIALEK